MKRTLYIAAVLAVGLLTACNKDWTPESGPDQTDEITVRFSKAPMHTLRTKADSIDANEEDDTIDRLDVYVYDNKDTVLVNHHVFTDASGVDLSSIDVKYYDVSGTTLYFFALANLDEATANYLAGLSRTRICTYYGGLIPLEAGNFRAHKPIMGGAVTGSLGKSSYNYSDTGNRELTLVLYRYLARFEIEKITADFSSSELMNSDVIVKGIVWTNVANALRPLMYFPGSNYAESPGPIWGSRSTYYSNTEFGNLEYADGYHYYQANENHHGWVSLQENYNLSGWGATGTLAADFPYIYNNNYQLAKGVINVDAPGYMATATSHFFTGEEGRVCSSTNSSQAHVFNANKVFYIYPIGRNSYGSYMCTEFNGQDDTIKMVIVVEINGETYYYPYRVMYVQPNSIYKVHNITLKGIGSEYSNFYLKKYGASLSAIEINGWNELEVDNIDMGYKDYGGTEIY